MAESKIEWTDYTFNPWRGCTKVSPACENCYAETMSKRNPAVLGVWGKHGTRTIAAESYWKQPVLWDRWAREGICMKCKGRGIVPSKEFDWRPCESCDEKGRVELYRARVFCASLADVFEANETMPEYAIAPVRNARLRLLKLIWATPNLDWLLLTKRPEKIKEVLIDTVAGEWADPNDFTDRIHAWVAGTRLPHNVWLGTTVENQKYADIRIPQLLKIQAKVRFLSVEPMLGPINISRIETFQFRGAELVNPLTGELQDMFGVRVGYTNKIDWVIVGGESGPNARPLHPEWVRSLQGQVLNARGDGEFSPAFFFKQWGEWWPISQTPTGWIDKHPRYAKRRMVLQIDGTDQGLRFPQGAMTCFNVGKKVSGRLLEGAGWNELPEVSR